MFPGVNTFSLSSDQFNNQKCSLINCSDPGFKLPLGTFALISLFPCCSNEDNIIFKKVRFVPIFIVQCLDLVSRHFKLIFMLHLHWLKQKRGSLENPAFRKDFFIKPKLSHNHQNQQEETEHQPYVRSWEQSFVCVAFKGCLLSLKEKLPFWWKSGLWPCWKVMFLC